MASNQLEVMGDNYDTLADKIQSIYNRLIQSQGYRSAKVKAVVKIVKAYRGEAGSLLSAPSASGLQHGRDGLLHSSPLAFQRNPQSGSE